MAFYFGIHFELPAKGGRRPIRQGSTGATMHPTKSQGTPCTAFVRGQEAILEHASTLSNDATCYLKARVCRPLVAKPRALIP